MRIPIRGIQVVLISAFFLSLLAWGMDINEYLRDSAMLDYDANARSSYWGQKLTDLGYTIFYLGDAAIIELLMRIWISLKSSNETHGDEPTTTPQ